MHLNYMILADAAEVSQLGKLAMLGGNIDQFNVPALPAMIGALALIVNLVVEPEEVEKPHTAFLEVINSEGQNILPKTSFEFTPHPNGPMSAELPVRYLVVGNLSGLVFIQPGKHIFRMLVDGEEMGSLPVVVVHTPIRGVQEEKEEA